MDYIKVRPSFLFGVALLVLVLGAGLNVRAQSEPALPPPLETMQSQGAQLRYLGREHGLDGWIAIFGGQEQYFYVLPDGRAFVMGLMFDSNGDIVTVEQVRALQDGPDGNLLDLLANGDNAQSGQVQPKIPGRAERAEFKTPSEQLYDNVENSNWVALGQESAPAIYTFIDPQCPHCHNFIKDMRASIESGRVQVRLIPVGFRPETLSQAAFLLAMPNPGQRFLRHLEGDETALPVVTDINQQGVQRNLAIMQSWKLNVTPMTVYRASNGSVKIVQGRARDVDTILRDLQ